MTVFEIEEYELHTSKYRVEAETIEEAIQKHRDQESDFVDDSLVYSNIPEDYHMSEDQAQELGVDVSDVVGIRAIKIVE